MRRQEVISERAVGLGLRRAILEETLAAPSGAIDFVECAPENWIRLGGRYAAMFDRVVSRYPLTCHGLSLDLGGIAPFDSEYLGEIRSFLDTHNVTLYSEHLSYCADGTARLHELLPIPFTEEAVEHVSARIRQVQDTLGRRIAIENVSYYAPSAMQLTEPEFVNAVLETADCDLLLDVNNLYVNYINHGTDTHELMRTIKPARVASYHVAGHYDEADDFKIDSHGMPVINNVWDLLKDAYATIGHRPTLLERDFNFPPLDELLAEIEHARSLQ